jgi:hypothetical protein
MRYAWENYSGFTTEEREFLRILSNTADIFSTIHGVCKFVIQPKDEAIETIADLEGAEWLTYARKADSQSLYVGLSERVARRQLVSKKFRSKRYDNTITSNTS